MFGPKTWAVARSGAVTRRESADAPDSRERTYAGLLIALLVVCFAVFAALDVPRLTNNVFGDLAVTGWSGPFAKRILSGDAAYVDFVVPIPPGSFLILALVQKLAGRALLLQELWVIALCRLAMALSAYAIVRPFASRHVSVLVAFASLVVLLQSQKECAYDSTAQLVAWLGIALGARALVHAGNEKRRRVWFAAAGFAASATLLFEKSTALGTLVGWSFAFAYLVFAKRRSSSTERLGPSAAAFGAGILAGLVLLVVTLVAMGSNASAYIQAVLVDSAPLKGGPSARLVNLVGHTLAGAAFPSSLFLCLGFAFVVIRLAKKQGLVPALDTSTLDRRSAGIIASSVVLVFGSASLFLALHVTRIPDAPLYYLERLARLPSLGLFFACVFFVVHSSRGTDTASIRGHQQNALLVVAFVTSLLHDASNPTFHPFQANNPIIPFAFLYLFVALGRAGLSWCRVVVFALSLLTLYSTKLDRAFRAQTRVGSTTHWAGLRINEQGILVLGAALRAQELAAETDTVLVLPEDLELTALIDRRRPPLVGGVVYVDQYPARLAERDIATLLEHPPKVLLLRPRDPNEWRKVFSLYGKNTGTSLMLDAVRERLLPRYRLDRSVLTRHEDRAIPLELWVRND